MLLKKTILFSSEHPEYFLPNIGHSLLRTSVGFIPNIQHSTFRTSVIFYSEHPSFYVPNILCFPLRTSGRLSFRTSGLFKETGVRNTLFWPMSVKKQGRKGTTPILHSVVFSMEICIERMSFGSFHRRHSDSKDLIFYFTPQLFKPPGDY